METDDNGSKTNKLKISIGNAHFEAEGDAGAVAEQALKFMAAIEKFDKEGLFAGGMQPQPPPPPPLQPLPVIPGTDTPLPLRQQADDEQIARVFRRDGDTISLLVLPRGEDPFGDGLLLLMYGFQRVLGRNAVTGGMLLKAARQSGIDMPRVDKILERRNDYVLMAGAHRGRVYSLNNRGVAYASTIASRIFD